MASWATIQFRSESIQKHDAMNVIIPDGAGPFPVLYLLHGLSDNYSAWQRWTSIERYASSHKLIVVMPNGHRSWYVNDARPGGLAYEDHIIKDVVGYVDRVLPTIRHRRGRAIAGLSMGGYGAMMLAMKNADVFSTAVGHSSAFGFARDLKLERSGLDELQGSLPRGKYDLFALARKLKRSGDKLAIRFDCGVNDFLIESSRQFHAHLDKLGIAHEYAEHPGEHNWSYWDAHVPQTLEFVMKHLSSSR